MNGKSPVDNTRDPRLSHAISVALNRGVIRIVKFPVFPPGDRVYVFMRESCVYI